MVYLQYYIDIHEFCGTCNDNLALIYLTQTTRSKITNNSIKSDAFFPETLYKTGDKKN